MNKLVKFLPIILLFSIICGGAVGHFYGSQINFLKPIGEIYLRLIFIVIVPLLFFSITNAIARLEQGIGKLLSKIIFSFFFTSLIAAIFMITVVIYFPPVANLPSVIHHANETLTLQKFNIADVLTSANFIEMFSHKNILPLLIFSILLGIAVNSTKSESFVNFLNAGEQVFTKMMNNLMLFAPIGFFAYFATIVADLGANLLIAYFNIFCLYYLCGIIYFIVAFSFYAFLADGLHGVRKLWRYIWTPAITALATCSGIASIPSNLIATKNMQIPDSIRNTLIPMGAILHKDGSVLGAVLKIVFIFGFYHLQFKGFNIYLSATLLALLVGVVMGAIPSGGMLGEMFILSYFGFPSESLLLIAAISIIIDPLATLLNVTGDITSAMLVASWSKKEKIIGSETFRLRSLCELRRDLGI